MTFASEDTQTAYYQLSLDLQVTLSDLAELLAGMGLQLHIMQSHDANNLEIVLRIFN